MNKQEILQRERDGLEKAAGDWNRKAERRSKHIIFLMDKNDRLNHEIRRLEDALVQISRLELPRQHGVVGEIVTRTIPKRLKHIAEGTES